MVLKNSIRRYILLLFPSHWVRDPYFTMISKLALITYILTYNKLDCVFHHEQTLSTPYRPCIIFTVDPPVGFENAWLERPFHNTKTRIMFILVASLVEISAASEGLKGGLGGGGSFGCHSIAYKEVILFFLYLFASTVVHSLRLSLMLASMPYKGYHTLQEHHEPQEILTLAMQCLWLWLNFNNENYIV